MDTLAAFQFDRGGDRGWSQARALLESEHQRLAVGQIAVPFGVCSEPSNVKAGGGACPFRFRCLGCGHFRSDPAYPEIVLIGLLIVLLDLAAIGGLIIAIVVAALRLRHSRLARPGMATIRCWTSLIMLLAALGLLVLGNARFLNSSYDQGRPAPAQVAGTWTDTDGATLQVLPDGTFTAAGLPADANDPAGDGKPHPADGHGTWQITRGDGTWYELFTLSDGSQFRLDAGSSASPRDASTAMFSYVFAQYNPVNLWAFYRR